MALGYEEPAALAARGVAVAAGHVGGGRRLVEEDELVVVEVGLSLEPRLTRRPHVGPLLLSRVLRPFLRLIPWRAKKRDSPLVLVCTPCPARASRNSPRQAFGPGLVEGEDQIRMRLDRRQAVVAVCRFGGDVTLLRKPSRPAAGARHAHPEPRRRLMEGSALCHGRQTRSRRSTDNREGIAGSFTGQRSSHRPVATPPGTALRRRGARPEPAAWPARIPTMTGR